MKLSRHKTRTAVVCALSYALGAALMGQNSETEIEGDEIYELDAFTVTAQVVDKIDTYALGEVNFIDEVELNRIAQSTLGETLSWQPGVSSSYFGQGSSRPVIRGFEGYRVRMLQDSIGTLDVSDSSPDHGVAIEPLLIREIEIHRGSGALLFGNSAIGGAVNSKTRLIAEEYPTRPISGAVEGRIESVNNGKSVAAYVEIPVERFVVNLMGSWRDADDYDIVGKAWTNAYENEFNPEVNDPDLGTNVPIENPSDTLPNSYFESEMKAVGITWMPESTPVQLGAGYTRFDSEYGIPYQYSGGANDLFGYSSLDMKQERIDLDGRVELDFGWFSSIHAHAGYAEYKHHEFFSGLAKDSDKQFDDTNYEQDSFEGRVDFYQHKTEWTEGVVGLQMSRQKLDVSFLALAPQEDTRVPYAFETENVGVFLLETVSLGSVDLQTGFRMESQTMDDNTFEQYDYVVKNDDTSISFANSLTWEVTNIGVLDSLSLTPSFSYIERIPTATERRAFWPNPAIQRFVIGGDLDGDPLDIEESLGYEFGVEARAGIFTGRLNLYYYDYDNFIFLQDRKGIDNQAQYVEAEAEFYGFEAEVTLTQEIGDGATLILKGMFDSVRANNKTDDQNLPRIPPQRIGTRIELKHTNWQTGLDVRYAFSQDRVQPESDVVQPELLTDGYTEVNWDASYTFVLRDITMDLFVKVNNVLDEERRVHTSFIKDVAPLPARNVVLGLRSSF
ncbi:MAG: iron complex outermembrane receptor protein [Lentimonas sp.]|jgi:iron complex outermembrane receptor protein